MLEHTRRASWEAGEAAAPTDGFGALRMQRPRSLRGPPSPGTDLLVTPWRSQLLTLLLDLFKGALKVSPKALGQLQQPEPCSSTAASRNATSSGASAAMQKLRAARGQLACSLEAAQHFS